MIASLARKLLIAPLVAIAFASAQTQVDLQHQARGIDFTSASYTKPIRMGNALPASCGAGEAFLLTSAPAGANVYFCLQANQWTAQSQIPSGGAVGGASSLSSANAVNCATSAGVIGPCSSGATIPGLTIGATLLMDSGSYPTLALGCSAAHAASATLLISKAWLNVPTQTCSANLEFRSGGSIQPAASATVTLGGALSAGLYQIFDASLGGGIVLSKLVPGVYPQWFGGQTANDSFDNIPALTATQNASIPNGIPILITGRMQIASPLYPLSNTTWKGTGSLSEIVGNQVAESPFGVFALCGSYPESPSTNPCYGGFVTSTYVHPINPALRGSTTLTSNPSGGFANIVQGQRILLVEGNAPKWDTYVSFHKVTAISGDTITLDRPTEFDFTGATGSTNFGVISIAGPDNIRVSNLLVTMGASNGIPYSFSTALATNITFDSCTFKSESATYLEAVGFCNLAFNCQLRNNVWLTGMFKGSNLGSYNVEEGDIALHIGQQNHEEGQGSNHIVTRNNTFANQSPTFLSGLLAGSAYYWTIEGNVIRTTGLVPPIDIQGAGWQVTHNTIIGSTGGIEFIPGTFTNDLLRTHDILIEGNYIETRANGQPCFYPPSPGIAFNVQVIGNTFNCPIPVSWNGGVDSTDTNTITYFGNNEITQQGVTPTAGVNGYTASGAASGGPSSGGLASIPVVGGALRFVHSYPSGTNVQTFNSGDILIGNAATADTGAAVGTFAQICTASGTYGTLSGVTGSTVSGSNILTITAGTVIGQRYYTITGVSGTIHLVFQINATHWQMDSTANATVTSAPVAYAVPAFTTVPLGFSASNSSVINGTSGSATCQQSVAQLQKIASCRLNGYAQTGTAQTYSFPTAFGATPILQESGGSCGTYNPTTTASTLTLPANAGMTAETCNVVLIGQ